MKSRYIYLGFCIEGVGGVPISKKKLSLSIHKCFVLSKYLDKIDSPELKEAFMSTADMQIAQGLEQGIAKEKIETARKMLEAGFDLLVISRLTELTEDSLIEIRDSLL